MVTDTRVWGTPLTWGPLPPWQLQLLVASNTNSVVTKKNSNPNG